MSPVTSAHLGRLWAEQEINDGSTEQMSNAGERVAVAWRPAKCGW